MTSSISYKVLRNRDAALSPRRLAQDRLDALGDDPLLAGLEREDGDAHAALARSRHAADLDRGVALHQVARERFARDADAFLVPGDDEVRHAVGRRRRDALALHGRDALDRRFDDADAPLLFAHLRLVIEADETLDRRHRGDHVLLRHLQGPADARTVRIGVA